MVFVRRASLSGAGRTVIGPVPPRHFDVDSGLVFHVVVTRPITTFYGTWARYMMHSYTPLLVWVISPAWS